MALAPKALTHRIWQGSVRMSEAREGTRFPLLNNIMAAVLILFMLGMPLIVLVGLHEAISTDYYASLPAFVFVAATWLLLAWLILAYGRETADN